MMGHPSCVGWSRIDNYHWWLVEKNNRSGNGKE